MDRGFARLVFDEFRGLVPWWQALLVALAFAVLKAGGRSLGGALVKALKGLEIEPQVYMDEFGPPRPGVALPTDPDNPGGGPTGGQG